jgi:hypothetical protein
MALKYAVSDYEFLIDGIDYAPFLDSFGISVPIAEPSEILAWSGDFTLSWNRFAQKNNIPKAVFSPLTNPLVWRPGLAVVQITINGYSLPPLRIQRYAFNPTTLKGQGSLVQALTLLAGSRPSYEPEIEVGRATPIAAVIRTLLESSLEGVTIAPSISIALDESQLTGEIDSAVTTRDPVGDAQGLAGVNWHWLIMAANEVITSVSGDPLSRPIIFSRAINQVEMEPDLAAIDFASEKVIVTGSRQVPEDALPDCPEEPNAGQDSQGRKKFDIVDVYEPFGVLFPRSGTSTNLVLAERVVTRYAYNSDDSGISLIDFSFPLEVGADINTATPFNTHDIDANTPIATVTITSRVAGAIFPRLGTNTTLRVAEVRVETPFVRSRYVPYGIISPKAGDNFNLYPDRREVLTSQRVPETPDHTGAVDPKTGRPGCLEKPPAPEPAQTAPEIPLKTESLRGECNVQPTNWTPIRNRPHIVDFGFIPSQAHADNLACQIAYREHRRRDSMQVQMPIPDEWLAAGCPLLARCWIDDAEYQMDGIIIAIGGDGKAKFSFSGGRVGSITPVPPQLPTPAYVPTGALQLLAPPAFEATVGVQMQTLILRGGAR